MYQNSPTKCLIQNARLSYVSLDQPRANADGGDPKYSATLLISKADVNTEADIRAAINAAYENGVQNKWNGSRPQLKYPVIYDGDGVRPSGEPFGDECKGHWVITASSKLKPQCVHISNVHAGLLPSDVYSGMFAHVTVNFYPYDNKGNRGVGCGLGNVCKVKDGEPLGGRTNADTDFAGIAQPAGAQQGYAQTTPPQQGYGMPQAAPQGYTVPQVTTMPGQPQMMIDPITGQPIYNN